MAVPGYDGIGRNSDWCSFGLVTVSNHHSSNAIIFLPTKADEQIFVRHIWSRFIYVFIHKNGSNYVHKHSDNNGKTSIKKVGFYNVSSQSKTQPVLAHNR